MKQLPARAVCASCKATDTPMETKVIDNIPVVMCVAPGPCIRRAKAAGVWALS